MKIKANKSILLKELSTAAKYRGGGKDSVGSPYISLTASENGLLIQATDNQVYYENTLPLQVVGEEDLEVVHEVLEGGIVALTPKFEEVLRKIPSTQVEITVADTQITFTADGVSAKLTTVECDFPPAPEGTEGEVINSPKSFFNTIVKNTSFAASTVDSRPVLKGINLKGDGTNFIAVATDSHRLARFEQEQTIVFNEVTIPAKQFTSILETFNDEEKVKLVPFGNHVKLIQEERIVYIRLLESNFPDTSRLININHDKVTKIKINAKQLNEAIDRALPFAKNDKKRAPIVQLEITENGVRIFSAAEEGSMDSIVPIIEQHGAGITEKIALNAIFTTDAIKSHNCKEVTVVLEDKAKPVYILGELEGSTQLILPIRY